MKKVYLFAAVVTSFFMMVSASVWEGTAAIGDDFPEKGPYLATNSFPVNTMVEVVNLESNKTATLIVSTSLDNSKLLALLSKDAADAIGLNNTGRIRMQEKDDQVTYSGVGERRFFSGDPNYTSDLEGYDLTFVPAETRPPEDFREPDPGSFIPSITRITEEPVVTITPVIPSIPEQAPPPPVTANKTTPSFSPLLIESFIRGSYYVQIGAYEKTQTVESEISKIDKNLPVAVMETVMKTGNTEKLVYRVLIGPLNLGESGAVFQKYRAIYKDAFLWVGN
jgi:hypothetical protein